MNNITEIDCVVDDTFKAFNIPTPHCVKPGNGKKHHNRKICLSLKLPPWGCVFGGC